MSDTLRMFAVVPAKADAPDTTSAQQRSARGAGLKPLPELLLDEVMKMNAASSAALQERLEAQRIFVSPFDLEATLEALVAERRLGRDGALFVAIKPQVMTQHLGETLKSTMERDRDQ
jgi:hypothetical protein